MPATRTTTTRHPDATAAHAAAAAAVIAAHHLPLSAPLRLYLSGELGAGKTHWTRALLRALGATGRLRSPSYTLVSSLAIATTAGPLAVHHIDCYRLGGAPAGDDLAELLDAPALTIVEWPGNAADLPPPDARLRFHLPPPPANANANAATTADTHRRLRLSAHSPAGARLVTGLPPAPAQP